MLLLQRWNFLARARLERQLWDAFERGEDIEGLVEQCRRECRGVSEAPAGEDPPKDPLLPLRLQVWETTLRRIRRIEATMAGRRPPRDEPSDGSIGDS